MSAAGQVGFVMLAHARLDRAGAVARHLADWGMVGVVHLDVRVPLNTQKDFASKVGEGVSVIAEHAAEWGRFGLVDATLAGAARLLSDHPGLSHICLISGACLPLRPVADLQAFLAAHPDTDFIESVPVAEDQWVEDGLSLERFTLFHPFSHRHSRWWFSRSVDVQRKLGVRRRLPRGLAPHLGAQWWCLSAKTLRAILEHPDLPRWTHFFRRSWIPDESFFQTLVRAVRPDAAPGPKLTLGRFNRAGRPVVFHDDHAEVLAGSDHFFARKIDPDAGALYERFLGPALPEKGAGFTGQADETSFEEARARFHSEAAGVLGPGRLPKGTKLTRCDTARPYLVVVSEDADLLGALLPHLQTGATEHVVHGRLFPPKAPAVFVGASTYYKGNISAEPTLRDPRPAQFLARLIWADGDRPLVFLLCPDDAEGIRFQLVQDPNARLLVLAESSNAARIIKHLARPFGGRLPDAARNLRVQAWHRTADPGPLRAALTGQGGDGPVQELMSIVCGPWDQTAFWSVPA
ncbi:MAG: beta-1,6-N-acetylglucosaminyltransferase [Pseudomonadota bacterium]